jgi:hypothetical protein
MKYVHVKKLKILLMILILMMTIVWQVGETYATGSFSVSASATSVNPGTNVTISVSVNNAAGKFTASSSNASVVSVSSQPDWANNNTVTFTV